MRNLYYLIICFLSFSVLSAQEKLSKEEKARREKNIQAGNPFAKYGCKAPVATLSKGKYLEVHDLDSIVTIGTSRWDVDNKKIVGDIKIDSSNVDAQPIGDAPGMWMSPDPLSEEFPSWSPYTMCYDNPVKYKDPDGRAADDWRNTNGDLVYDPSKNGGRGGYTEFASAQDKQFGNALRNSGERGSQAFDKLVNSSAKITVEFHNEETGTGMWQMGHTDIGTEGNGYTTQSDGSIKLDKAKIDIYVDTANKFVDGVNKGEVVKSENGTTYQNQTIDLVKNNNLTGNNVATAIFGHEIGHTDNNNVKQQVQEINGTAKTNVNSNYQQLGSELSPQITQVKILQGIITKK